MLVFIRKGTTVYVTFLDPSKAFDRIDHWLLFNKMIKKGVPLFIIKLLVFWYSRQRMFVRWSNTCSTSFCVTILITHTCTHTYTHTYTYTVLTSSRTNLIAPFCEIHFITVLIIRWVLSRCIMCQSLI